MNTITEKEFLNRWKSATKKVYNIDLIEAYKIKLLCKRIALCPENNRTITVHRNRATLVSALLILIDVDFITSTFIGEKKKVVEFRPKSLSDYRADREEKITASFIYE